MSHNIPLLLVTRFRMSCSLATCRLWIELNPWILGLAGVLRWLAGGSIRLDAVECMVEEIVECAKIVSFFLVFNIASFSASRSWWDGMAGGLLMNERTGG